MKKTNLSLIGVGPRGEPLSHTALQPEYGRCLGDFTPVADGLDVITGNMQFQRTCVWKPVFIHKKPPMVFRLNLAGRDRVTLPHIGYEATHSDNDFHLYMGPSYSNAEVEWATTSPIKFSSLLLSVDRLEHIFSDFKMPTQVRDFIGGKNHTVASPKSTPRLRRLAQELNLCPYTGSMRAMYQYGKSLEIISELLPFFDGGDFEKPQLSNLERRRIYEAREILMANLANPPSIEEIASKVQTSPRKLNAAFREAYGKNVFDCLMDWKLDYANTLLKETDLTIKEIAFQLGYAYPNNFIKVFTAKFGNSPGIYRKQK